ncbi:MAG: hypothetical protein WGN25_00900 [Candidatus Electrothrix sp. GW3-4]|uniref:hypothetical protein n=1 Tax=Candidatus Electrothrix sp. GW3-4 TaxID=3126740 RepID=UPI0030D0DFFE
MERYIGREEGIILSGNVSHLFKETGQIKEALEKVGPGDLTHQHSNDLEVLPVLLPQALL